MRLTYAAQLYLQSLRPVCSAGRVRPRDRHLLRCSAVAGVGGARGSCNAGDAMCDPADEKSQGTAGASPPAASPPPAAPALLLALRLAGQPHALRVFDEGGYLVILAAQVHPGPAISRDAHRLMLPREDLPELCPPGALPSAAAYEALHLPARQRLWRLLVPQLQLRAVAGGARRQLVLRRPPQSAPGDVQGEATELQQRCAARRRASARRRVFSHIAAAHAQAAGAAAAACRCARGGCGR